MVDVEVRGDRIADLCQWHITALQMYWGGAASAQDVFAAQEAEYNKSLK